jgi:UDP-glucose 4-epimerase
MNELKPSAAQRIFITGADGFLGRGLVAALAREPGVQTIVAADVREVPQERRLSGVVYMVQDVRDPKLGETLAAHDIDTVVHLASIVTPGKNSNREFEYSVDVLGSRNVLDACVAQGVQHIVVSSSGAAYGYHADNPAWLRESDALRGNTVFAYSDHKRLVEEMLGNTTNNTQRSPKPCCASAPSWVSGWTTRSLHCLTNRHCWPFGAATAPLSSSGTKT